MIAFLRGEVIRVSPKHVILDVQGVGYGVQIPERLIEEYSAIIGSSVELSISTYVRETALQLFGFPNDLERDLFELLLEASGVGPKAALAILSRFTGDELLHAIDGHEIARFTAVPGIGKKTAEKLVLDLQEKCRKRFGPTAKLVGQRKTPAKAIGPAFYADLSQALNSLGYKDIEIRRIFEVLKDDLNPTMDLEAALKVCLRHLAGKHQSSGTQMVTNELN